MKKNITINLFGSLYAIDEDAYNLLKNYEDNLKAYFRKQEGGDEITDDIEHRIAEIFEELKQQGVQAISIEHIEDIIGRIGKPEQMEQKTEDNNTSQSNNSYHDANNQTTNTNSKKKLFRDPNHCMLGGVLSGLSCYFGGDIVFWRIIFILLTFFTSFTFACIYLILWVVVPKASTTEDFLLMKGIPVTADNIGQAVVDEQQNYGQNHPPQKRNGCLSIIKVLFLVFGTIFAMMLLLFILFVTFQGFGIPRIFSFCSNSIWLVVVYSVFALAILIYAIYQYATIRKNPTKYSKKNRIIWIILLIALFSFFITKSITTYRDIKQDKEFCLMNLNNIGNIDNAFDNDEDNKYQERFSKDVNRLINNKKITIDDFQLIDKEQTNNFYVIGSEVIVQPGYYRFTIIAKGNSLAPQCQAYVNTSQLGEIRKEIPKTHSKYLDPSNLINSQPIIIDSIPITEETTIEYGIMFNNTFEQNAYVAYRSSYSKLERIGDIKKAEQPTSKRKRQK